MYVPDRDDVSPAMPLGLGTFCEIMLLKKHCSQSVRADTVDGVHRQVSLKSPQDCVKIRHYE